MAGKVVWKLEGSRSFRSGGVFGVGTAVGIVLAILALFAGGAVAAELANLVWGPLSLTVYTIVTFGMGAVFVFLAMQIAQRLDKGRGGGNRGLPARECAPAEPGIIELGFDRVGTICRSWLGYFGLFFGIMLVSRLFRTGRGSGSGAKESYFWDMLLMLAKGFGLPLVVMAVIVVVLGLLEKRKRATR